MKVTIARRIFVALIAIVCALTLALVALAETPAAQKQSLDGVAHHWVTRQMRYAPYTAPNTAEKDARVAAVAALTVPPAALIAQADKGYPDAQALIELVRSLKNADPAITGHEVLVWNEDRAVRLYVSADGVVEMLGTGTPQEVLVERAIAATDPADRDAIEIAKAAFNVGASLDASTSPATGGLVAAHGVGFAHEDGSHVVVRVDTAGNTSYPGW